MAKKSKSKDASPESAQSEERITAIKAEITQAMIQRNTLPKSASDEQKAAAIECVNQLQAQLHEAVQHELAIKRDETTKLEREHKDKKLRHKRLMASRQPTGHTVADEEPSTSHRHESGRMPMDRAAEEAEMDAANEEDLLLERQRLAEEERESAEELAYLRSRAKAKRKADEATKRREAEERQRNEAEAKVEAVRLKEDKDARTKKRQQAALQRSEEAKDMKRQRVSEREARKRAEQDAQPSTWLSKALYQFKKFFSGSR